MKRTTVFPILLFCIAAFIAGVEQAEAQGSVDTDREALVALYDATKGDDWNDNTNWKSDKPLDQWYGIRTDNNGRVITISLINNILTGSIPSELGDLVNLEELYLAHNSLIGSIPPAICSLFSKEIKFDLSGNIDLVIDCFNTPDELLNNERRYFTTFDNKNVEFILLQENQYGIIWISIDTFGSVSISIESIRELLDYVSISSTPADSIRGIFEYSRDLLGTVFKNPRNDERKIDIFFHLFAGRGLSLKHEMYINPAKFNDLSIKDLAGLISHEYVHNINFAYARYHSFFREGLADWVANDIIFDGKNIPLITPFTRPNLSVYFGYRNKPLFPPQPFHYVQAGLFTAYLAQRIGIENMKHLIQVCRPGGICDVDNPDNGDWYHGIDGLDYALFSINPDLTLEKIVIDYHTTNIVNDSSVVLNGVKYGYKSIKYGDKRFKITPNIVVDFHNNSFSQKEIELKPGGVNYIAYENASNLHFAIDTSNKQLTLLRLFKEKGDTKELVGIDRNVDEYMVSGDYDRITLIAVHANPRLDQADIALTISATQNYGVATEDQELPTAFSLE